MMEKAKLKVKRHYKTHDQAEALIEAQKLIEKTKKKHRKLQSIRIDADTIVQIQSGRSNVDNIINRVKNKRKTINLIEQIEYGNYA